MNHEMDRAAVVGRLIEKAHLAIAAAERELQAGDVGLASNRVYYACFYAASAVLLKEGKQFVKHSGLRAALHRHLTATGRLSREMARFFDKAFAERQEADYNALIEMDAAVVENRLTDARRFVAAMVALTKLAPPPA